MHKYSRDEITLVPNEERNMTIIHQAAQEGDLTKLEHLVLNEGINVNELDSVSPRNPWRLPSFKLILLTKGETYSVTLGCPVWTS